MSALSPKVIPFPSAKRSPEPAAVISQERLRLGRELLERGADVLILDCLGFHQHHRDLLQKALDVPVLLSNVLMARLAAELLIS